MKKFLSWNIRREADRYSLYNTSICLLIGLGVLLSSFNIIHLTNAFFFASIYAIGMQFYSVLLIVKALKRRSNFRHKFCSRLESLIFEARQNKAFTPEMVVERAEQYKEVLREQVKAGII